ncbi:MAG: alpha/beta fold hydrolase [Myxococcota bacterium]
MFRWLCATFVLLGIACTTVKVEEEDAFDRKRTVSIEALNARGVEVRSFRRTMEDGVALDVRHIAPAHPRATVLFFGGNGFLMVTAHDLVETLLALDLAVLMFDYRGYGQSEGVPSVEAIKSDALRLYAFATKDLAISPEQLVVHGHSMGTLAATWVATQRDAAGLVLESPVSNAEDLLDRLTPWLVDLFLTIEVAPSLAREDNSRRLASVTAPILMMVGEKDFVTPPSMAQDLHQAAPVGTQLVVLPDRGHNDLPLDADYRTAYEALLVKALAAQASPKPDKTR